MLVDAFWVRSWKRSARKKRRAKRRGRRKKRRRERRMKVVRGVRVMHMVNLDVWMEDEGCGKDM